MAGHHPRRYWLIPLLINVGQPAIFTILTSIGAVLTYMMVTLLRLRVRLRGLLLR